MPMPKDKPTPVMKPDGLNDAPQKGGGDLVPSPAKSGDVLSSYIFSTSSRSLSKYGERLLMEAISVAQEYTLDAALGINKLNFSEKYNEQFAVIEIPIRNLLNADDKTNYTKAKEAAMELMQIYHTVEAPVYDENGNPKTYSDGTPQYQFASYHLLDKVYVNQKPGIVSVKLGSDTWSQILDMSKGYTRYNLLTAKSLNDVVAIRLFQIMSNTSEPLTFSIEKIKGILGLQDKYVSNVNGFIRRVIIPAEEEIEEKCLFEVVHELIYGQKEGKAGRPGVTGIRFIKRPKRTNLLNPKVVLDPGLLNILVKNFGFDDKGIRSNMRLFYELKEAGIDTAGFLLGIEDKARQANSPQAYAIKSLKNLLAGGGAAAPRRPSVPRSASPKTAAAPAASGGGKPSAAGESSPKKTGSRLSVNDAESYDSSGLEEI